MSNINFAANILSPIALKTLFISNYGNSYGVPAGRPYPGISLYNNRLYQCFRNAAFYFLNRMQSEIWRGIGRLPAVPPTTDPDFDQYLIIQTFVEIMDDGIINRLYPGADAIERKRTNFIDDRFQQLRIPQADSKYSNYGVLSRTNLQAKHQQSARSMGFVDDPTTNKTAVQIAEGMGLLGPGGLTMDVFIEFLENRIYFRSHTAESNNLPNIPLTTIEPLNTTQDYIRIKKIGDILSINDFITNIGNYRTIQNTNGEGYRLVGVLYDCANHQITSVCFGNDCDLANPRHIFMDDHVKHVKQLSAPFNQAGLQYACTTGYVNVQYLLYEKVSVRADLQAEIQAFISSNGIHRTTPFVVVGGGNNDYYSLYQKYKNKYLQLKNKLN
jgi:hypothetical protein